MQELSQWCPADLQVIWSRGNLLRGIEFSCKCRDEPIAAGNHEVLHTCDIEPRRHVRTFQHASSTCTFLHKHIATAAVA